MHKCNTEQRQSVSELILQISKCQIKAFIRITDALNYVNRGHGRVFDFLIHI